MCIKSRAKQIRFLLLVVFALYISVYLFSIPAIAAPYESYGTKVTASVEYMSDEPNIKLASAACTVAYSQPCYHGGGYDGTNLWLKVFKETLPGNKWVRACEVNTAAIVRWSGIDSSYPVYVTNNFFVNYIKKSDKWKVVGIWNGDESSLLPGDILITVGNKYLPPDLKLNSDKLHVCMYVGNEILTSVYKKYVKRTDGDIGEPMPDASFVSAHSGGANLNNPKNGIGGSMAPCMVNAYRASAKDRWNCKYLVIRLKGAVSVEESKKAKKRRQVVQDGVYTFSTALKSTMALNTKNSSKKTGATTQINTSNHSASQRWRLTFDKKDGYYKIVNVKSGKALSVSGGKAINKAWVVQKPWKNSKTQKWALEKASGGYKIYSAANKELVLDVYWAGTEEGTPIEIHTRNGNNAQIWKIKRMKASIANQTYIIKNAFTKKNLATTNKKTNALAKQVKPKASSKAQQWIFTYEKKNGYYTIKNARSGKILASTGNKVKQISSKKGSLYSKWHIQKSGSRFVIFNAATGKALAVTKHSKKNGAAATLAKRSTKESDQKWNLNVVKRKTSQKKAQGLSIK